MIETSFNGFIFEPKDGCLEDEVFQAVQRELGSDWSIEKLGYVIPHLIAKPKGDATFALSEIWNLTYRISKLDSVMYAEPDFNQIPAISTKKSLIDCDPHLPNTQYENWARDQIRVPNMDNIKMPFASSKPWGKGIIVGHTDTGYTQHREIKNPRLLIDRGWDYYRGDKDAFDNQADHNLLTQYGHGTSTSSLIFSDPKDGGYITGVAKASELIPIRIDISVIVNMEKLIRGFGFAIYRGCHITSTSMGHVVGDAFSVDRVLKQGVDNGVISFAAAGQAGGWEANIMPARSNYAVSCTASNIYERPWSKGFKSNYIDVGAPGESVWVADIKDANDIARVGRYCGTSFSTALTAGAAALWYAYLSPQELYRRYGKHNIFYAYMKTLQRYGIRKPQGWDPIYHGPGILDVQSHLQGSLNFPDVREIEEFREMHEKTGKISQLRRTLELFYEEDQPEAIKALCMLLSCKETDLEKVLSIVGAEIRFHLKCNDNASESFQALVNDCQMGVVDHDSEMLYKLIEVFWTKGSDTLKEILKPNNKNNGPVPNIIGSLRKITNQSDYRVSFIKLENRSNVGLVEANDSAEIDVWFPWVANPSEFVTKVLIVEVVGYTRYYIWESGNMLWYTQSSYPLEGPFEKHTEVHGYANEYNKGNLVPGKYKKGNKEIQIRNNGSNILIEFFDY